MPRQNEDWIEDQHEVCVAVKKIRNREGRAALFGLKYGSSGYILPEWISAVNPHRPYFCAAFAGKAARAA
jgi:hypothetical protein